METDLTSVKLITSHFPHPRNKISQHINVLTQYQNLQSATMSWIDITHIYLIYSLLSTSYVPTLWTESLNVFHNLCHHCLSYNQKIITKYLQHCHNNDTPTYPEIINNINSTPENFIYPVINQANPPANLLLRIQPKISVFHATSPHEEFNLALSQLPQASNTKTQILIPKGYIDHHQLQNLITEYNYLFPTQNICLNIPRKLTQTQLFATLSLIGNIIVNPNEICTNPSSILTNPYLFDAETRLTINRNFPNLGHSPSYLAIITALDKIAELSPSNPTNAITGFTRTIKIYQQSQSKHKASIWFQKLLAITLTQDQADISYYHIKEFCQHLANNPCEHLVNLEQALFITSNLGDKFEFEISNPLDANIVITQLPNYLPITTTTTYILGCSQYEWPHQKIALPNLLNHINTSHLTLTYTQNSCDHPQPLSKHFQFLNPPPPQAIPHPISKTADNNLTNHHLPTAQTNIDIFSNNLTGGPTAIDRFNACPLRANLEFKLQLNPTPRFPNYAIDPLTKGKIIHQALELLLQNTSVKLPQPVEYWQTKLTAIIKSIFTSPPYQYLSPPIINAAQQDIILKINKFLQLEYLRAPFTIYATEQKIALSHNSLILNGRIDRIDTTKGGKIIIDYKTGTIPSNPFANSPPRSLQTIIYSLTMPPQEIGGFIWAYLANTKVRYLGITKSANIFPGVPAFTPTPAMPTWHEQVAAWQDYARTQITAYASGYAQALPSSPQVCQSCHFQRICQYTPNQHMEEVNA